VTRVRAVTFDVTHTLIHCPRVAEIYAEVLGRHGSAAPVAEVRRLIPVVWQEFSCHRRLGQDRFAAHPGGAEGFWRSFLERLCQHLEIATPSRFAAAELYHRFSQADAWSVFPDVRPVLVRLQELGLALAVVSNWDERLGRLLTHLDLTRFFDAIVFSAGLGVEKPDARIFLYALELLKVPPGLAVHIGDSLKEDVEGAQAAGMRALHLVRRRPSGAARPDQTGGAGEVADLSVLPELLAPSAVKTP
jgi:REG-2-like HAD superfamily hydrolase